MEEDATILDTKSAKRYPLTHFKDESFLSWAESAFAALTLGSARMFGVYPVKNGYFMKDLPYMTTDLRFCVGTLWGCINDKNIMLTIEEKEDFERTLLSYEKHGTIHRYNHIAPMTSFYRTPGGMQSRGKDRASASKDSCEYLIQRFPTLCKFHRVKKSGIHEVKLASNR
jgi:hypothetical protein